MPRKIFVSYKYGDRQVAAMPELIGGLGTCRDYVDVTMGLLENIEIYKGEDGYNDLSRFKDETIRTHLKAKIRDSSVTIVFISKGMKDFRHESDQWIPWEISYSLKRNAYGEKRSSSNGLIAVVIPDETGSYDYYFQPSGCGHCNSRVHQTNALFQILRNNMFNLKQAKGVTCPSPTHAMTTFYGDDHSYIHQIKWIDFIRQPSHHVDRAIDRRDNIEAYDIQKRVYV